MAELLIYFFLAIGATMAGAMTGMGGGVIIKPLLDMLGGYNVETIGILSALAVFTMSVVAIGKHILNRTMIPLATALPLATGAVAGGVLGERLLQTTIDLLGLERWVTVAQNLILAALIVGVLLYMKNKERIPGHCLSGVVPSLLAGVFLGLCSSFLGIGGGPINVALIIYLFSYDTKTAAVCSLITILFAQISKLTTVAVTTGFGGFDLAMFPAMAAGAVCGGLLGAGLNRKCPARTVEHAFNGVQIVVLTIAALNIARNLGF